ncbi:ribulose-phosphate 3-epimerase [Clostridium cochlearium]|jgi:ribulose-phosphate 3-epimerase|uniref:Ribulose-phosphate 3-epimerase n=1 Tax=Clostridium cochlearium TaxID=1494 RepID=A0A239ZX45_CLOCO|nr:ribulose-phosphate 3-epimerase [Clostridium cochlearium]MBV1818070.1 ribulose-phosphate 3-epimerase [Bacteroidales bacterium MSK.15.36]NSJ90030.1 ribulose-phosphate 3-epimerase [Coprococcus sp. MSK.21.13]MBE6064274.1 ribulose-phosphate 3-epimerase [Clostridium cochlearium]MCG4572272.1 ribulose-phosphate 3-epimerase [Clostridium cochlearium]MCG4578951.1 ribulose-phosphate 3-epimerase [Clostridium cochlearium]
MVKIAPSILSADFANLGRDIESIEKYGADVVHFDVMDGRYVPNISFGVPIMKSIKGLTKLPFDVHLMIEEPSKYIEDFAKSGADIITFHYEAETHIDRTINYIKSFGVKAGIALNPGTSVSLIKDLIPSLDMVLIMSVNPGFGGQKYIPYASEKIRELKKLKDELNKDLIIEVDGGVGKDNIKDIVNCGVDLVVAGSAVFKDGKIEENLKELRGALK